MGEISGQEVNTVNLLIFLGVLSILIIIHELGHFLMARRSGVKVEEFSVGFGRKLLSFIKGDTEYSLRLVPMGGYVKLAGDNPEELTGAPYEFLAKSGLVRAKIIFMGPFLNYLLAFIIFWAICIIGYPTLTSKVGGLIEDFPASEAGIKKGDTILSIDGSAVKYWEDMQKLIRNNTAGYVSLAIDRNGKVVNKKVDLKTETVQDLIGRKHKINLIGIMPSEDLVHIKFGAVESLRRAGERLFALTSMTYQALWRIVTGALSVRESVTGPLGIFYITSRAASTGLVALLHVMAVISMSLAIFNLLPLPVLDGGHMFLILIEKIKGSRVSVKTQKIVNDIGLTLIIALAIMIFINDIIKFQVVEKVAGFFGR